MALDVEDIREAVLVAIVLEDTILTIVVLIAHIVPLVVIVAVVATVVVQVITQTRDVLVAEVEVSLMRINYRSDFTNLFVCKVCTDMDDSVALIRIGDGSRANPLV